jgi:hypothetical protein
MSITSTKSVASFIFICLAALGTATCGSIEEDSPVAPTEVTPPTPAPTPAPATDTCAGTDTQPAAIVERRSERDGHD